tara:strand:- start:708 stop:1013 length:306 start_codon:yes stop_codon:yes gene_type:complete
MLLPNDNSVPESTAVTAAFAGVVVLKTKSPITTGKGVVVDVKVAPESTSLFVTTEVLAPLSTELPTPTQAKKFGFGIGIESLGVTCITWVVLTVILGYAII